jgi:hypothetical protein
MKFYKFLIIPFFLLSNLYGQVFLQIEKANSPKTIKYTEGTILEYSLKEYPDVWRKSTIQEIIPETGYILFDDNYHKPEAIAALRFNRPMVSGIGKKLMQVSAVWFVYGGIASLTPEYNMSTDEMIIGASAATLGFLIKKIFGKRKMKLGKHRNLRIVDLRM